jgi:hypothetical protein
MITVIALSLRTILFLDTGSVIKDRIKLKCQDRIDKLNSIDFVWDVNAHDWNENYVSQYIFVLSLK